MSTKHTPGPWQVQLSAGRPLGIYAPGDDGIPGAVGCIVRRNGIGLPSSPVALANARLMAAAPDLLAALRECRRKLYDEWPDSMSEADFAILDTLIAKAEGRT